MNTVTFFVLIGGIFFLLTCWAILHAAGREFDSFPKKAVWMLVAAVPFIGWLIYFLFGRRKPQKSKTAANTALKTKKA